MKQIFTFLFLLYVTFINAIIINIPADQPTIQAGITASANGDTVLVQPGTYVENINYSGKLITVASLFLTTQDTTYISSTIINGNANGSVVIFDSGEDSTTVLCGFTITNGSSYYGGGIYLSGNCNPSLENVTISGNTASRGGGIYLTGNSNPSLINVVISENSVSSEYSGSDGGGIYCWNSNPSLENVIISGNTATAYGGGIFLKYFSNPNLANVTIKENLAEESGGGIYFLDSCNPNFNIDNRCNIYQNLSSSGNDLYANNSFNIDVVLDTFTVINPTYYYAQPLDNFTFDILHAKVNLVNSDLYVSPEGDNANSGQLPSEPLGTISFAFSKIFADNLNPHTIYLAEGTYSTTANGEHFPLNMVSYISLSGESENGVILDAEGVGSVIKFHDDQEITIEDLTIINGLDSPGSGIDCWESSPNLVNITVSDNTGQGIYCYFSNPSLVNVTVSGNTGGGIKCITSSPSLDAVTVSGNGSVGIICDHNSNLIMTNVIVSDNGSSGMIIGSSSNPILSNVTITGNMATNSGAALGGGIYCADSCNPSLENVTITGNTASDQGGGIFLRNNCNPSLENVTISGNTASVGGGIYMVSDSSPIFNTENRCNIYFNYAGVGNDLYADYNSPIIDVVVDTFTVIDPTDYYAQPLENFTFDILHSKIEMVNSDLYVNPAGNNANSGQSSTDPLRTINFALSKIQADSLNHHTIHLANGVYSPSTTGEHFPLNMVSYVSVSGESESGVILDAEGLVGGLAFHQDQSNVIDNLTLTGGYSDFFYGFGGGGIVCIGSSPSIENVTVSGNNATNGGGIYCNDSSPSLVNVTISGNAAFNGSGGGLNCYNNSNPSLINVTLSGNNATLHGGGIYCSYSSPSLENVTVIGNSATNGGGIHCSSSNPDLENVTISGNNAGQGGGIYCKDGLSLSFVNCIMWNDTPEEVYFSGYGDPNTITISYSEIDGGEAGIVTNGNATVNWLAGNVNTNPLFVNPSIGDYYLQSTSPCIDAGDPTSPLDPDGTITDMGAYYYDQILNPIPPIADFIADTTNGYSPLQVNFTDLSSPRAIDEWLWDFGDGNNSVLQDPVNEYYNRGSYTVSLSVSDVFDSTDTEIKVDYITVLNSVPVVQTAITDFSFDEDTVYSSINLNTVFDDADIPYGDILSFSYSGNTFINVSIVSGIVTLTPDPDWFGFEDITFTATDDSLASINDEVRVTINNVNDAPVIDSYDPSYSPITIDETESQLFWVSASDIDGDPLSYQWCVDDVPQTGQNDSTYTHTTNYTSSGTYMIKCIVDDGAAERTVSFSRFPEVDKTNRINLNSEDNRATDYQEWQLIVIDVDQNIIVNDIQPAPGPVVIDEMDTINFLIDAIDPDGNPLEYSWKLDGVEESTISTYDFTTDYSSAGNYLVTLDVTDNFTDNLIYYEWNVTVNDVDQAIVVNSIVPDPGSIIIQEGDIINFSIDAYDPDGNPLEYSWELNGVEESTNSTFDFETDYTSAGEYLVTLEVTDNFGTRRISGVSRNTLNYSWDVTVNDVDQAIVVNELIPLEGNIIIDEGDVINFSIDAYDPDGNPLEYSWELDGVEVSTNSTYTFETDYTTAGEYVITLEVTDNFGTRSISGISRNTLNYSWGVTVNDVDQLIIINELIPPEGNIFIDEGDVINFSIDAYDPDGNDLEYSWQVEGEEVSVENTFDFITDENSAGEYEVTLFVTDNFSTRDELNFLWNITVNDVSGSGEITIPSITKLYQNYPNPFNPETNIQFDIKDDETGILTIFNMKGQIVVSQNFNPGRHSYLWNAQNCSSGVYFYKLQTERTNVNKKMLLLK